MTLKGKLGCGEQTITLTYCTVLGHLTQTNSLTAPDNYTTTTHVVFEQYGKQCNISVCAE